MQRLSRLILLLGLLVTACGPRASAGVATNDFPTTGWPVSTPAEQGMDTDLLDQMQAEIEAESLALDSLLIIRHGKIVSETYYGGATQRATHELYSVTKSFTATLVGMALDQGLLPGLDARAVDLLPTLEYQEMDERKQAMTVDDLLTMRSGLDWAEGDPTYTAMYRSASWVQYVMDLPMDYEPGKWFLYCSGCSHLLSAIVDRAAPKGALAFAEKNLFEPLGIQARWEADRQDIPIGGWGLSLTPRDMAKLGYLYLHEGRWEDRQIVPAEWTREATRKHTSTDGRLGYGYQWWTYYSHDAYAALGRYGQTIFVAPGLDLIIVTTARIEEGHDPIFDLIDTYILPAVD